MSDFRATLKAMVFTTFLERNPRMLGAVRRIQFTMWRIGAGFRSVFRPSAPDPDQLLDVPPRSITLYVGSTSTSRFHMRGRVVEGDWDLGAQPFRGWDLYKAMKARFLEGTSWEETPFYDRVSAEISEGQVKWGCTSQDEFAVRLEKLDELYGRISRDGFKSQRTVSESDGAHHTWEEESPFAPYDEVVVCIDRNGRFMLRDGKHRLSIAKILDLPTIPVAVGRRHRAWWALREDLREWIDSQGGASPESFWHPDLQDLPVSPPGSWMKEIQSYLRETGADPTTRSVLDIGSVSGYHSTGLADVGYSCTIVGLEPSEKRLAERVQDSAETQVAVADADSVSIRNASGEARFTDALLLNFTAPRSTDPPSLETCRRLLEQLKVDRIFLAVHTQSDSDSSTGEPRGDGTDRLKFVLESTIVHSVKKLASHANQAELFVLEG